MPLYEYKCKKCDKVFDVFKSHTDISEAELCRECKSVMVRIMSAPYLRGETVVQEQ